MTGSIYILRNKINGKCYVGQSINVQKRFAYYQKCHDYKKTPTYIERAIAKYGWGAFEKFAYSGIPIPMLDSFERKMIASVGCLKPRGYNLESGGSKNKRHHPESNRKRSIAITGEQHPLYGTHLSDEAKKHLSEYWKGRIFTPETRAKLSEASKGIPKGEKHREALKRARLGKCMGADAYNSVKVQCVETGEIYLSIADARSEYKIKSGHHISECCQGKLKTCGGFRWEYVNKESA